MRTEDRTTADVRGKAGKIAVDYIARVEGEGSVKFEIADGRLKDLKLNIWEPPRFFEGFLVGRKYDEAPDIVARICGICPVAHMVTSIRALEKAMEFTPSPETVKLRKIMALSQIIASHIVHLYLLVLPDYYGVELLSGRGQEIARLMRMKEAVNAVTAAFGGRALHPVAMVAGGFTRVPSRDIVGSLIGGLEAIREDAFETVKMLAGLRYPDFERETERVALKGEDVYPVNKGMIASDQGLALREDDYLSYFTEEEVPYSHAKRTKVKGRGSLMVGALSRFKLNFQLLHPEGKRAAEMIGFKTSVKNPFHNITAQGIEIIHGIEECIELLDQVSCRDYPVKIEVREGRGSAVTEAPRGLLCHQYTVNRRGIIEKANIVTPTAHNSLSLEESLRQLVGENIDRPEKELALLCEMLVRAYDPCFSCSVH